MSQKVEVVRKYHEEAYANPPSSAIAAAEKYISDSYQGMDNDGNVTSNKAAFVGMNKLFFNAFKDFRGVTHDIQEVDGKVLLTFHFEGTHTGDLDLSAMGLGVIPATGKRVETPEAKSWFMVEGDQIVGTQPISGGFESILAQIGPNPQEA